MGRSSSSASVRSSLSKSSKREKKEGKENKEKKKKSSKKSSSSKSLGDPPSSVRLEAAAVPQQVEWTKAREVASTRGVSRTSAAPELPEDDEESPLPSPASILRTKTSSSRAPQEPPTSLVRASLNQQQPPAPTAPPADSRLKPAGPSPAAAVAVAPAPTPLPPSSSPPVPEHVTFDDSSNHNHSSNGSIRVSFSNDVVSVSSTTYDDATYNEESDEDTDDEEAALPTLVTQSLWSPDPKAVRIALRDLIRALTEEEEEADEDDLDPRHEALLLGGHLALIRVLQSHLPQPSSDVAIQALQALLLMFENVNAYWLGVLGSMGAVEAVVSTLMVKSQDLTVQEQAYRLLLSLLGVKANAVQFLRLDGLAAVFRRLEAFPEDRETNLDVCHVLKKLCEWDDTRAMLVSSGAVRTLAGVIDRCSGSDGTSVTSATTLTTDSPSVDGHGTVVSSASTIAHDPAVQASAYETMAALVAPERRGSHHHRHRNDRRGSSSASSLGKKASKLKRRSTASSSSKSSTSRSRRHPHSCETVLEEELQQEREAEEEPETPPQPYQEYSTVIVRDLWSDCDEVVRAALKDIAATLDKCKHTYGKAFIEVGGPLAVTKVMEARRCPDVQQAGCEILHTLVSLEGFPTILGEVGGVETLLERLRDGSSVKLRKSALKALGKMLKGSNSNTQRFIAAGGVPVLVRVMELHEEYSSFQEESCKVLKLCCSRTSDASSSSKYKTGIIKSGGATAIARVLEVHLGDAKASKAAKKAMKALLD